MEHYIISELNNKEVLRKLFINCIDIYFDEYEFNDYCYFYSSKDSKYKLGFKFTRCLSSDGTCISSLLLKLEGPKHFNIEEDDKNYDLLVIVLEDFLNDKEQHYEEILVLFEKQLDNINKKIKLPIQICSQCGVNCLKACCSSSCDYCLTIYCKNCINYEYDKIECKLCIENTLIQAKITTECCNTEYHLACLSNWCKCVKSAKGKDYDVCCPNCDDVLNKQSIFIEVLDYIKYL